MIALSRTASILVSSDRCWTLTGEEIAAFGGGQALCSNIKTGQPAQKRLQLIGSSVKLFSRQLGLEYGNSQIDPSSRFRYIEQFLDCR
jgi:hypothetical protein